jgi:hypothetical protein
LQAYFEFDPPASLHWKGKPMAAANDEKSPGEWVLNLLPARFKRGRWRPPKGLDPVTAISPQQLTAIEAWAALQPDTPSRSEAIRRLIELGLDRSRQ